MPRTAPLTWLLAIFLLASHGVSNAQSNRIQITDSPSGTPNGAALEISSTASNNKGFLIPRMTESQRNAISATTGLQVYQTDGAKGFYHYNGSAWEAWNKPVSGVISMAPTGSTVIRGDGFSVTHEGTGRDLVTFHSQYALPFPMISLGSSTIEGVPPVIPNDLCNAVLTTCADAHIKYINIQYPTTGGPFEFQTGTTNCNTAPNNRTTYLWGDPEWTGLPASIVAGTQMRLFFNTTSSINNSLSAWVDWNQDGSFSATERIHSEGMISGTPRDFFITVPATACNGYTALRLIVRDDVSNHNIACDVETGTNGEAEELELLISGGVDCSSSYQRRSTNCNVSGLNNQQFRVECSDKRGDKVDAEYHFRIIKN